MSCPRRRRWCATPDVPMAQALWAYLMLHRRGRRRRRPPVGRRPGALAGRWGPREGGHHRALEAWASGDWRRAAAVLDDLLIEWPTDLLALMMGHQLGFYVGDAANLRRVGRSLGVSAPTTRTAAWSRACARSGWRSRPLRAGRAARPGRSRPQPRRVGDPRRGPHPRDAGRRRRWPGLPRPAGRRRHEGNLFMVHLAWHRALFLLDAGRVDDVLATYDTWAYSAEAPAAPLQLLDASACCGACCSTASTSATGSPAWPARRSAGPGRRYRGGGGLVVPVQRHRRPWPSPGPAGRARLGRSSPASGPTPLRRAANWGGAGPGPAPDQATMAAQAGCPRPGPRWRSSRSRHEDVVADLSHPPDAAPLRWLRPARRLGAHAARVGPRLRPARLRPALSVSGWPPARPAGTPPSAGRTGRPGRPHLTRRVADRAPRGSAGQDLTISRA